MLDIDDLSFDAAYFEARYREFDALPHLSRSAGKRCAIATTDSAEWIALCLYLRDREASIAPLHPSTPLEAARRLARRMRCHQLLYHGVSNPIELECGERSAHPSLLQLSSGTTGEPKCLERGWDDVNDEIADYSVALQEHAERRPIVACPITHSYGLISGVFSALARGVRPWVLTNFNPKYVIRHATGADRGLLLYASPTLLNVLVRLLPETERLCPVMISGAPLRSSCLTELEQRTAGVLQQYGCSEVGCISLSRAVRAANDVGVPLARLGVSAGTREHPEEIRVRIGERTVETRDLGYFVDGSLYFVARVDDTINVAGVNVYPQEVEEVILDFPGIDEAVVYKRPDPYASERVCLKFTAKTRIDLGELRRFCAENLTPYAVPVDVQEVDAIPKLENGKINRRKLVDEAKPRGTDE